MEHQLDIDHVEPESKAFARIEVLLAAFVRNYVLVGWALRHQSHDRLKMEEHIEVLVRT
jgi:hypothetical protein